MFYSKNAQITALIGTLIKQSESFARFTDDREKKLSTEAEAIRKATTDRAKSITETSARKSMLAVSKRADTKIINQMRRDMQEAAKADVETHFKHFKSWQENLATTLDLTGSPRAVAARAGLGSPERQTMQETLRGAGSQELLQMSKLFLAEGNEIGIAAVLSEAGRNPKRHSQFDAAEYAEQAVGNDFKNTKALLDEASLILNGLGDQRTIFQRSGEKDSGMRIRQGIHARQVASAKEDMIERNKALGAEQALEATS